MDVEMFKVEFSVSYVGEQNCWGFLRRATNCQVGIPVDIKLVGSYTLGPSPGTLAR